MTAFSAQQKARDKLEGLSAVVVWSVIMKENKDLDPSLVDNSN